MIDVVFPSGNEEEFIAMAKKVGICGLIFCYKRREDMLSKSLEFPTMNAIYGEAPVVAKAKSASILSVCTASREALERGAGIVFGFEGSEHKDHTHYRNS